MRERIAEILWSKSYALNGYPAWQFIYDPKRVTQPEVLANDDGTVTFLHAREISGAVQHCLETADAILCEIMMKGQAN